MQFNFLSVENVGNFLGRHEFHLNPAKEQPIALFGGLNGAGKTTIFEAIKLCLYGSEMFGAIGVANYHKYLKGKIHKSKTTRLPIDSASIEVEFDYADFSGLNRFMVTRAWRVSGATVKESFNIKKNGLPLDEIERDSFQDFVKEMIPLALSELFFFDGEKIRRMMADDKSHELRNAILSLLGLDVIERLQADLKIYRSKHLQEFTSTSIASKISLYRDEKQAFEHQINELEGQKAGLENKLKKSENKLTSYKCKMAAQGEGYFKKRAENEERKRTLEKALEQIKDKLRELSSGYLPVVIASTCADKFKAQVKRENESRANRLLQAALADKRESLLRVFDEDDLFTESKLSRKATETLKQALFDKINALFLTENPDEVEEVFGFSEKQTVEVLSAVENAQNELPAQIIKFSNKYEELFRELQKIISQLDRTPDDEFIRPMYETLQELEAERGGLFRQKEEFSEKIADCRNGIAELDRKIEVCEKKLLANEKASKKLETVSKVQTVLEKYYKELTRKKITLLQEEFSKVFNLLHRKEDMISRVEIDPDSCAVSIFDATGSLVKRSTLSSGELEIYAISMLWALAKTSGQKLPFIIDTPLARLDSKHRDNLIQHFFPVASHQVMVFSTNTEVDQQYFDLLRPHVSQAYNLDYDETAQNTVVKEGYFWN